MYVENVPETIDGSIMRCRLTEAHTDTNDALACIQFVCSEYYWERLFLQHELFHNYSVGGDAAYMGPCAAIWMQA